MPRIAEGKYLKMLHEMFESGGLLDLNQEGVRERFCPVCDLKGTCVREGTEGKISPLCLDGVASMILSQS